ncbi:MAG: SIMPL domain-containing protein, partial [Thermoproteota archaeon]|nr:SIMPL domain-containing protein [Thermoproteota archaeon]
MEILKKITIFSFILFIISVFIIATAPTVHAQNIVLPDDKPTLSVIGEAEKQIPSDQTKISLAVENTATDSNVARKINAERMDKIISSLNAKGLTNKNISTTNFEISP